MLRLAKSPWRVIIPASQSTSAARILSCDLGPVAPAVTASVTAAAVLHVRIARFQKSVLIAISGLRLVAAADS